MNDEVAALLERARDEVFHAKVLVRQVRNSTKTTAAALQDSESRLDRLIDDIDAIRNPTPREAQGAEDRKEALV